MSARYLEHFRLSAAPFSKEIEDEELWIPTTRATVVDELVDSGKQRGHSLLTGEPGVGKTCVLRALRQRLPEAGFRLTYCHNATLGRRDFYRQLCMAMGLSPKATAAAVFYEVSSHVKQLGEEKVHPVFLLDEAHLLHQDVLDHLHILANYEWDKRPLRMDRFAREDAVLLLKRRKFRGILLRIEITEFEPRALGAVRIPVQRLTPGVVDLQPDAAHALLLERCNDE